MKVVEPGRSYELAGGNGLVFREMDDGCIVRDGTTNEEVLGLLVQRATEDYLALPCAENIRALYFLREALAVLRTRSALPASAIAEGRSQPLTPVVDTVEVPPRRIVPCAEDAPAQLSHARASAALAVFLRHRHDRTADPFPGRATVLNSGSAEAAA